MTSEMPWRVWTTAIILAVFCHLILFIIPWNRIVTLGLNSSIPSPIHVIPIDSKLVEKIRQNWAKSQTLLLDNGSAKSETAPKDAKYFSNKNIKVEKEQRAKTTQVMPSMHKPGGKENISKPLSKSTNQLSNLGVPIKFTPRQLQQPGNASSNTPAVPGGDQAIDEQLTYGSSNMLNAQENVYYSYYARLYESIAPIWQSRIHAITFNRRLPSNDYITQADVVFDESGNLLEINFLQRSGVDEFDDAVNYSWRKVGRFPNPPKDLLDAKNQIHTGWSFHVRFGSGLNFEYVPPEQFY